MKRQIALAAVVPVLAFGAVACGDDDEEPAAAGGAATEQQDTATADSATQQQEGEDIVALAQGNEDLSTLVEAVTAAELVETLRGEGPFTVFAPTNAAFEQVGEQQLQELLEPENREQLTEILTYHVVEGELRAADLEDGQTLTTVNGEELAVSIDGDEVQVGDATVAQPDVDASNGVVHVIDSVLMPGS
jgi:uncharacterized surface protein with fasciclin (FAS1) repeats